MRDVTVLRLLLAAVIAAIGVKVWFDPPVWAWNDDVDLTGEKVTSAFGIALGEVLHPDWIIKKGVRQKRYDLRGNEIPELGTIHCKAIEINPPEPDNNFQEYIAYWVEDNGLVRKIIANNMTDSFEECRAVQSVVAQRLQESYGPLMEWEFEPSILTRTRFGAKGYRFQYGSLNTSRSITLDCNDRLLSLSLSADDVFEDWKEQHPDGGDDPSGLACNRPKNSRWLDRADAPRGSKALDDRDCGTIAKIAREVAIWRDSGKPFLQSRKDIFNASRRHGTNDRLLLGVVEHVYVNSSLSPNSIKAHWDAACALR